MVLVVLQHSVSVAQVCLRWVLQRGCVMAVGTGSNASKAAEYDACGINLPFEIMHD